MSMEKTTDGDLGRSVSATLATHSSVYSGRGRGGFSHRSIVALALCAAANSGTVGRLHSGYATAPRTPLPMKRLTGVDDVLPAFSGAPARQGTLTSIDLFAGAGGLTAGLRRGSERIRTIRAVEHDAAAAATFEANHGQGIAYAGGIEEWLDQESVPEVDLVVGGPPCQGFSQLNRNRVGVERNALWEKYAATIAEAKPRWFVMENVATFLKAPEYQQMLTWTQPGGLLKDWVVEARVLLAADFGAPQKRRRAVVLGHRKDVSPLGFPWPSHDETSHPTVRAALSGVRPAVTATDLPDRRTEFAGRKFPGPFRTDELHLTRQYAPISLARFRSVPAGGNRFDLPDELKTPCWRVHTTGSGDVMGRLHWDRPSVTIRTEFFKPEKGRYLHPTENRAITHFEAARIQGFADDYLWVGSKSEIARQIGNAVPLALGSALGAAIGERA